MNGSVDGSNQAMSGKAARQAVAGADASRERGRGVRAQAQVRPQRGVRAATVGAGADASRERRTWRRASPEGQQ